MKFGKEFASQMVPEWQDAYMDYDHLKTLLKEIIRIKRRNHVSTPKNNQNGGLKRKMTLYRAFSGLISKSSGGGGQDVERGGDDDQAVPILVNAVSREDGSRRYETTFLMPAEEGGEYELVFFRRLDDEFEKVDEFYREKVGEVLKEAEILNKQMDALIAFRIKVENPQGWQWEDRSAEMTRLASDIATSAAALAASTPAGARTVRTGGMGIIQEGGSSTAERSSEEDDEEDEDEIDKSVGAKQVGMEQIQMRPMRAARPASIEILDRIKINNTLETPRSTIKGVLRVPNHTELKFSRENLKKVEEKLRRAFVAFYQKLRLLKSYSFLNTLAFSKIIKKYDKITSRNASKSYMKMVDSSHLGSSEEVTKLMERVEATFIKHFANANRGKGMTILRPKAKRERHRVTFSTGFFAGCVFSLIIALVLLIRARDILNHKGQVKYMETMFPLYSFFGLVVLHMLMYAADIYYWRRYRINYSFIFGFKQGTELGYKQVLLLSFGLGVFALLCVLGNLDMEMDPNTKDYEALTELLPLFLLVGLFIIMILPFNILYRSSRIFFLTCLFHCIAAPFYKVTLPDFFLGDQLTSQVQAIRSLEFYICYYGWGDFRRRKNTCPDSDVYKTFLFIVAVIPYMSRLLQCLRRMVEEKSLDQGYNGVKYFLTIVAVCLRTAYSLNKGFSLEVFAWIFSATAAIFCTYWDFVHDWGLLNRKSKNRWLRDKLLVPHKKVYFIAMILNVILRFAWMQTVLNFQLSFMHKQTMTSVVASLEIIRRGIWNFFRLENEHLNNVGKFRAFKTVPLPFNYDEDDDKDV